VLSPRRAFSAVRSSLLAALGAAATTVLLPACDGPSKDAALEAIRAGVTEDGSCTLPLDVMKQLKMQYSSRGICVPKEGAARAGGCMEALAAAGLTTKLETKYMLAWPDEVAAASLTDVPAYDRRARSQLFDACYAMSDALREGRFACAEVKAEKALRIGKKGPDRFDVKYARALAYVPAIAAIDKACGEVSRPPAESRVELKRTASEWVIEGAAAVSSADAGAR
jgi:hypothetical protein